MLAQKSALAPLYPGAAGAANGVVPAQPVPDGPAGMNGAAAPAPVPVAAGELITAPLGGRLEGHHVVLRDDLITFGFLEGLGSNLPGPLLEALAGVIVDGSLFTFPPEADTDPEAHREAIRNGLRALHVRELAPLLAGIREAVQTIPKGR